MYLTKYSRIAGFYGFRLGAWLGRSFLEVQRYMGTMARGLVLESERYQAVLILRSGAVLSEGQDR